MASLVTCLQMRDSGRLAGSLLSYNFPKIRFCKSGHAIVGDNIAISDRAVKCRTCTRANELRTKNNGKLKEDVVRRALAALREGKTFHNLAGWQGEKYVGGRIVDSTRLNRFCDENPKMGKVIRRLAEKNKIEALRRPNPVRITSQTIVRASKDIMQVISAAVPRHLPRDLRDDAIQNIWLALVERRLKETEIGARAREFISAEFKIAHDKYSKTESLDVPIWVDRNTTLLDRLAGGSGLWD
jgi:hypothetical protein